MNGTELLVKPGVGRYRYSVNETSARHGRRCARKHTHVAEWTGERCRKTGCNPLAFDQPALCCPRAISSNVAGCSARRPLHNRACRIPLCRMVYRYVPVGLHPTTPKAKHSRSFHSGSNIARARFAVGHNPILRSFLRLRCPPPPLVRPPTTVRHDAAVARGRVQGRAPRHPRQRGDRARLERQRQQAPERRPRLLQWAPPERDVPHGHQQRLRRGDVRQLEDQPAEVRARISVCTRAELHTVAGRATSRL